MKETEHKKSESAYKEIKDKTASTSVVREGEWPNTSTPPSFESSEPQEEMRTKLQRYQQTLIARYYNNDLTEKEKIDLNKVIDELSDLLK